MPRLTFPITADGLCVDVRVNLDGPTLHALRGAGRPVPASIQAKGLIDTGTDISAVAPSILQRLGVPVYAHRRTQGIGGPVPVRLFKVTLFILDAGQPNLPWLVQLNSLVMELPSAIPVDVLIGLDILLGCKLLLDGPARQFALDF